jgi:trimethylamine--corrinoid protein Co-methyltransferase
MSETSTASEGGRRRGGGREARQARRAQGSVSAPPFITRKLPVYEVLGEEGLARVEDQADWILEEIGLEFRGDPEALQLWKDAGTEVKGERVRFPRGLVQQIIRRSVQPSFVQHARNPARSVTIGGDAIVFSPAYGSPFVRDLEGGRRYGTLEDFKSFVKLAYLSPWLHHSGGTICEPVDVPVNKRHLDMVAAHLLYSDKALMGAVTAPERAADSIELCRLVFGRDFVDANCVILGNINVNSPLVYDVTMTAALKVYAAANQCTVVVPFILGGAMGPVTTAGAIAQSHAEAMAGVALTQLVRPGAPVIYGSFLSSLSLRTGAPTFGMPEPSLAHLVVGQLARRLGVPLRCGGALTGSKLADAQGAQESSDALLTACIGGANFILHAAGWLEGGLTMGYEKFVLDCDHLGMMHTFLAGLALDDNAMAQEAYREVGIGKHYLGAGHTLKNYETAFYDSELASNESFEQWFEEGSKDANVRAAARVKKLLASYEPPPIDAGQREALEDYLAQRKAALPDAWH